MLPSLVLGEMWVKMFVHSFCLVSKVVHNEAKRSQLSEMRNRVKVKLTNSSVPLINRFTVTATLQIERVVLLY